MKRLLLPIFLIATLAGCSASVGDGNNGNNGDGNNDNAATNAMMADAGMDTGPAGDTATTDTGPSGDAETVDQGPSVDLGPLGGDRPVEVTLPTDYDESESYPVVVLLHGYTASSTLQNAYFRTSTLVDEYGFLLVLPDGTEDPQGNQFWNATNACCDFFSSGVDDSAYLRGVIDDVLERYAANPERVYLLGHSNGGYMSYRMACDHDDRIAAIASLAGSSWLDGDDCQAEDPVAVLQIHGTMDPTVQYGGMANAYPAAEDVVDRWATRNGCGAEPAFSGSANYDTSVVGDETDIERYPDCEAGVELWKMNGSGHIPSVGTDFTRAILDFLFEQRL